MGGGVSMMLRSRRTRRVRTNVQFFCFIPLHMHVDYDSFYHSSASSSSSSIDYVSMCLPALFRSHCMVFSIKEQSDERHFFAVKRSKRMSKHKTVVVRDDVVFRGFDSASANL